MDRALLRAVGAGAVVERGVTTAVWGKLAILADPGFCLVEFLDRGYDALTVPGPAGADPKGARDICDIP